MNEIRLQSELHTDTTSDNVYLVSVILVDGQLIAAGHLYATGLQELVASTSSGGAFSILTCWCGMPECAGIYQPVQVVHEGGVTHWILVEPAPRRTFEFSTASYQAAIEDGLARIRRDAQDLGLRPTEDAAQKLRIVPSYNAALLRPRESTRGKRRNHNR